jgi:hypothetical protein
MPNNYLRGQRRWQRLAFRLSTVQPDGGDGYATLDEDEDDDQPIRRAFNMSRPTDREGLQLVHFFKGVCHMPKPRSCRTAR